MELAGSTSITDTEMLAKKEIFILSGQSNMAGRGGVLLHTHPRKWDGVVPSECKPNPRILRLSAKLHWEPADEPLHHDIDSKKVCGVGPGMAFANTLIERGWCDAAIGLVPCAVGGTAIREWARGEHLYENMIRRAKEAVKNGSGEIKALLWYQGESDTYQQHEVDVYEMKMESLIRNVREDLSLPSLPIVQVAITSGDKFVEKIREIQLRMDMENLRCVDAKGLELKEDNMHLTTEAQVKLGGMLAESYLSHFAVPRKGQGINYNTVCCVLRAIAQMEEEKIEFSKRVTRPGHYTLMIKSFTLLSGILQRTPDVESFESPAFEVSGHKWKLSLYLVTADDAIDTVGSEINAMFKLFIMDQLQDTYLTVQDGEVRRFHGMKKMWGFTKLIPLCTFKDARSGYLVDDCCVFGVEILVIAPEVKSSFFSLVEKPLGGTFTWKVDNFFKCSDLSHSSEEFTVEGFQWTLSVHKHGEYLSFYLVPSDTP